MNKCESREWIRFGDKRMTANKANVTAVKAQSAGTPAQTNIMNCCDVVAGAGSTLKGQSRFELSGTMAAGIASCKLVALYGAHDNAFDANATMAVTIKEHLSGTLVAGS